MPHSNYTLSVPSSTQHLEDVRRFVEAHAVEADFPANDVEQLKIAVDEACTNIIKHAYRGEDTHRIDIEVLIEKDHFTVRIRDEGKTFHPETYKTPDILESIRSRRAGGYGVHIIRRLMDRVEYRTRGNMNEVSLTKFRNSNSVSSRNGFI